eukprot:Tamp_24193.p1 GENE.Tamp_24193~~Tamp_24193.p1  ORF type:complete len:255 (+),score=58.56 Tamp_24193:190-954(+)
MAGMRAWCATLALVALATLPVGRGFAPAAAPAARALRGGNGRRPGGRACASGAASLRAILDKIPLPQSPRPSEIMKSLENKEVQGSLDRFLKSAPEGLKRAADTVIPVAKAVLFNDEADLKKDQGLPAGWTEHLDEKTGLPFYYAVSTATTVWQRPSEPAPPAASAAATAGATKQTEAQVIKVTKAAPDSSSAIKDLARLMDSAVADSLPSPDDSRTTKGGAFDASSISLSWDEDDEDDDDPEWMLDSASYKPK